jgi:hypothetical protein
MLVALECERPMKRLMMKPVPPQTAALNSNLSGPRKSFRKADTVEATIRIDAGSSTVARVSRKSLTPRGALAQRRKHSDSEGDDGGRGGLPPN